MKDNKEEKNTSRIYNLITYLFAISIVLEANTAFVQLYGFHLQIRLLLTFVSVACAIYIIFKNIRGLNNKNINVILPYIMLILISSFVLFLCTDSTNGLGVLCLVFMVALPVFVIMFACMDQSSIRNLLKKVVNVILFISVVSLFFWLFASVLQIIEPTSDVKIVWGQPYSTIKSYYYAYFETQTETWLTDTSLVRNSGIFAEGPMYAFVLIVALLFNNTVLFEKNRKYTRRTIILLVTIVTTMSVTGVACSVIIMLFRIKDILLWIDSKKRPIIILFTIVAVLVAAPFALNVISRKTETSSYAHRSMDLDNGLAEFSKKPLFGHGINHDRETESNPEVGYGYSNAIIPILTDGGLLLLLIYLLPAFLLFKKMIKNRSTQAASYLFVFSIIIFTTLVQYRLLLMVLLAAMFSFSIKKHAFKNDNSGVVMKRISIRSSK